jgi:hypothetical protein
MEVLQKKVVLLERQFITLEEVVEPVTTHQLEV